MDAQPPKKHKTEHPTKTLVEYLTDNIIDDIEFLYLQTNTMTSLRDKYNTQDFTLTFEVVYRLLKKIPTTIGDLVVAKLVEFALSSLSLADVNDCLGPELYHTFVLKKVAQFQGTEYGAEEYYSVVVDLLNKIYFKLHKYLSNTCYITNFLELYIEGYGFGEQYKDLQLERGYIPSIFKGLAHLETRYIELANKMLDGEPASQSV